MSFCRPLHDKVSTAAFLKGVLNITQKKEIDDAVMKITKAELLVSSCQNKDTLKCEDYRNPSYKTDEDRIILREKILNELIHKKRLDSDDAIKLKKGGACPKNPMCENKAYIITGLPASGKSLVAAKVAEEKGAYILDSDFAKRKFPEYPDEYGASILHRESTLVVFGDDGDYKDEKCLKGYCICNGYNIVVPKIGHSSKTIIELAKYLKDYEYEVHLTLISLDRTKAVQRAYKRFIKTNRYVSLGMIFDEYSNNPMLEYYRMKDNPVFSSYGAISTDVEQGKLPKFLFGTEGNPALLYNN